MYYVYILSNEGGALYIGYSSDLKRRLGEHIQDKVDTTKRLGCKKLIYYEAFISESIARERERKLKQFGSSYQGLIKRLGLKR